LLGRRAVSLDSERQTVITDDGGELRYGAAVIATGVQPRMLPASDLDGVYVLRTSSDALSLRSRLSTGARLVIVGAGFLGLEVAATARALGVRVTIVEPMEHPMASALGSLAAGRLLGTHREQGVRILTGVGVDTLHGSERVRAVELTDGTRVEADIVLMAIGCAPRLDWLVDSGLECDNGIVCDKRCRAAPGVWAAGDVARWRHSALERHVRLEHRMNATEQGQAAARSILGDPEPFSPIPFFWTDQYDARVQVWGFVPAHTTEELSEGDADGDSFIVTFREDGRPVGALGWNAAPRLRVYREQIACGAA
jgi:NADPH-dependent 2,4-dienoyl-CoA reductase/sulfur reductase-like enzyme